MITFARFRRHARPLLFVWAVLPLVLPGLPAFAQEARPTPPASQTPAVAPAETQDEIKVFTEEVRIPIFAYDEYGRFDPTLEMRDMLVLEDDVAQEMRSLRRIPASILLLLGTGSEMNAAMRTSTTRDIALNLVEYLRTGDQFAVMQFAGRTELLQDWTAEKPPVERVLRTKLHSGRGSRLAEAIKKAAAQLQSQPIGNRHVVLVTDGVDMPGFADHKEAMKALAPAGDYARNARAELSQAIKELNRAQATVHVISYTSAARARTKESDKRSREQPAAPPGSVAASGITTVGIDPTLPPGMNRGGGAGRLVGASINFDPAMRALRKAYDRAMKASEGRLAALAEEMGGRIWLPSSDGEMITQGGQVAREIGAQYVMTYAPKRPLANSPITEYRRIRVIPRRTGLQLRARRGYIVAAMR